ncbi:hypothetical protein IVB02_21360 [Bradyrhizobium sp. 166]|uniref:hypothetical protein n=1 Tax=Bradyrhizobium sp. 166 TaxID=2782638 RepID=UPI001FF700FA|nr:hypothetical protein [Bradyrhizobium sp. 166]MCK1603915.1 hypothetical protein [Bradyrhizobium sp. 166]
MEKREDDLRAKFGMIAADERALSSYSTTSATARGMRECGREDGELLLGAYRQAILRQLAAQWPSQAPSHEGEVEKALRDS